MIKRIDHVVLLSEDLDVAMENAGAAGFSVTPGGGHESGGTHNALIPFADGSYIELLAFRGTPPPHHYFAARLAKGYGIADLALLSDDLDADLAAISARGITYPAPVDLARSRPDGMQVAWRMSLPATTLPGTGLPFLIQDTSERALRVSGETRHPNGAAGIAGVSLVTASIDDDARTLAAVLGVPESRSRFGAAAKGVTILPMPEGSQWLALVQALPDTAPMAHLDRFGAGPYAITLRGDGASGVQPWDGEPIDPALVSGARIMLAESGQGNF